MHSPVQRKKPQNGARGAQRVGEKMNFFYLIIIGKCVIALWKTRRGRWVNFFYRTATERKHVTITVRRRRFFTL